MAFERFYYYIEVLIYKNMIEELTALLEEVQISLCILHSVPDMLLGIATPAAETVKELGEHGSAALAWWQESE